MTLFQSASAHRTAVLLASSYLILTTNGALLLLVVALKPIALEFDWPRSVPSFAYSAQFIGAGIGGIFMGYWFDKRGAFPVVLLGSISIGIGATLGSMIESAWHLYLIYGVMLGALGQATMFSPLMVNVMRLYEERRGFAVGVVAAGQSVAGMLWPPLFRYVNDLVGWRETFFWFGLFALVTAVPTTFVLRQRSSARALKSSPTPAPKRAMPEIPNLRLPLWGIQLVVCLAIVGCCVSMSMPLAHLVSHADDVGHSMARGAEMLALALGATFVIRMAGGTLILDRFGGLVSLFIFSSVQAGSLALFALLDGLTAMYLVAIVFGLGYGGIGMCYPVIVREYMPPEQAGWRLGLVNTAGAMGMAIGGWVAGFMFDLTGAYAMGFWIGVGFNVVNLIIVAALIGRRRQTPPMQAATAR